MLEAWENWPKNAHVQCQSHDFFLSFKVIPHFCLQRKETFGALYIILKCNWWHKRTFGIYTIFRYFLAVH